jgi:hypothetical protein
MGMDGTVLEAANDKLAVIALILSGAGTLL